mgnify:CR=1 FL=1
MALITVNGVVLPTPTDFGVSIMDISKAERNAAGTMIIERITTKRKIALSWAYLSASDLSKVLNAVAPTFYNVTYLDPQTGGNRTGSFYCGDRDLGMIDFVNGVPRYKDIKFDLIER